MYQNRSSVQKRLSIYNWNPGPRRGKEGAIEKRIAGKWHIITLQEAIAYVDHELLAKRFHVTHYGGCAVLFNKDTFSPTSRSNSFTSTIPGANCLIKWKETQAGFDRACYHVPLFADNSSTIKRHSRSCHCTSVTNVYAKKRGIGKKLILTLGAVMFKENVDLVAWRRDNSNNISIIEEAFADCALPMPPVPTPLWGLRSIPGNWADVCRFLEPPESDRQWKVRVHGAFSIPGDVMGSRPNDQSCHHEAWLHLDLVGW